MKRKLMICAMALCICAGLTGNTGEVSVWASEESSSDAVRIGALKGPTAMWSIYRQLKENRQILS